MSLSLLQILFLINGAVILAAALLTVLSRNLIHSALWMVLSFLGVAVLYVMLGLGFFAVVQVVVYVGAIAVLILFAIMLTRRQMRDPEETLVSHWWVAGLAVVGFLALLIVVLLTVPGANTLLAPQTNGDLIRQLGRALVEPQQFGLLFEVSSLLLLITLVGAIYLAQDRSPKEGGKQ